MLLESQSAPLISENGFREMSALRPRREGPGCVTVAAQLRAFSLPGNSTHSVCGSHPVAKLLADLKDGLTGDLSSFLILGAEVLDGRLA